MEELVIWEFSQIGQRGAIWVLIIFMSFAIVVGYRRIKEQAKQHREERDERKADAKECQGMVVKAFNDMKAMMMELKALIRK